MRFVLSFHKSVQKEVNKMLIRKTLALFLCLTMATIITLVGVTPASAAASVTTDKADYAPEEIVVITGGGFIPSSSVLVEVTRPDGSIVHWDPVTQAFVPGGETVTADAAGGFVYNYQLDGVVGNYTVNASDGTNSATCTFSDTPIPYLHPEPLTTPGTSNTITWDAVSNATQYQAQASTDPTFATAILDSGTIYPLGGSTESYTFTGLSAGATYYYRVRAHNPGFWPTPSRWSDVRYTVFSTQESGPSDTIPPVISGTSGSGSGPGSPLTVTTHVTDNVGVATVELRYLSPAYTQRTITMTLVSGTAQDGIYSATIPAADVVSDLEYFVQATDSAGNGSTQGFFAVPSISGIGPTSGPVGTSVTITGADFGDTQGSSTVTFNGVAATVTSWSAISIVAIVPAGAIDGNVVVTTGTGSSNGVLFDVAAVAPTVSGISPSYGPTAGGTNVTVTGTNFASGATVTLGGVSTTNVVVVDSTTITCTTGAHASGVVDVVVTNPDTQSGTLTGGYTYTDMVRVEETAITYGGPTATAWGYWTGTAGSQSPSNGTQSWSKTSGAWATYTFNGTGIDWLIAKRNNYAIAQVYIDGVFQQSVDLYNPTDQFQAVVFSIRGLAAGTHTIKIVHSGTKNPASYDWYIGVDAFDVVNGAGVSRVQEQNLTLTGTWGNYSNGGTSAGSQNYSKTGGSTASYTFTGTGIDWIIAKNNNYGIAKVYIDGVLDQNVDLYNSTLVWQQVVYSKRGLTSGTHTIKIEVTGTKRAASYDYYVGIDAFNIWF